MQISVKVAVTGIFLYILYFQLQKGIDPENSTELILKSLSDSNPVFLFLFFILLGGNWGLESLKWRVLLRKFYSGVTFRESFNSVMTGLTFAIITPARIGEYGGRIVGLPSKFGVSAISAHFLGSMMQNFLILIFGYLSWILFYFYEEGKTEFPVVLLALSAFSIFLFSYFFVKKRRAIWAKVNSLHFSETWQKRISQLSVILLYNAGEIRTIAFLSSVRIGVFYTQYWLMLKIFGLDTGVTGFVIIALIYFVQTLIPLPAIFNWFVRGELALFFWGYLNVDEVTILTITYSLWLINLVFPAFLGLAIIGKFDFIKWFKNGKTT